MEIIIINEENHGCIAVARDYQSAVLWLIDNGWLSDYFEFWDDQKQKWVRIKDELGESWEDHVLSWDVYNFNLIFDSFYLSEQTLVEYNLAE